jgi:hypothetical protein
MELIEKYELELVERKQQSRELNELAEGESSFVDGIIAQLETTISDLKQVFNNYSIIDCSTTNTV